MKNMRIFQNLKDIALRQKKAIVLGLPFSVSVIAFCLGLFVSFLIIIFCSDSRETAASAFFTGPFSSPYFLSRFLTLAALLMFSGLGSALSIVTGNLNLGGEGQIYLGGFLAAVLLNKLVAAPSLFALFCIALFVFFAAGFMAFISGILKALKNCDVLLSSFLFSSCLIPVLDGAITGPLRDSSKNLLATPEILSKFRLPFFTWTGSSPIEFLLIIPLCIFISFFLNRTQTGRRIRITGQAPLFAKFEGYNVASYNNAGLFCSGALHGLTGFFAVCGTYYTCYSGFANGMGWNALTVALIAKNNPLAIIPSAFAYAYILSASDCAVLVNNLGFDLSGLIQAVILICISANISAIPAVTRKIISNVRYK